MSAHVYLLVHETEPRVKIGKAVDPISRAVALRHERFDFTRSRAWAVSDSNKALQLERILQLTFRDYWVDPAATRTIQRLDGYTEWYRIECLHRAAQFLDSNAAVFDCRQADPRGWAGAAAEDRLPLREHEIREMKSVERFAEVHCSARLHSAMELANKLAKRESLWYSDETLQHERDEEELARFRAKAWIALTDLVRIAERTVLLSHADSPYAELCTRVSADHVSQTGESLGKAGMVDFYIGFEERRSKISHSNFFPHYAGTLKPCGNQASLVITVLWEADKFVHSEMFRRAARCLRNLQPEIIGWDLPLAQEERQWAESGVRTIGWRLLEKRKNFR